MEGELRSPVAERVAFPEVGKVNSLFGRLVAKGLVGVGFLRVGIG